ncbi:MAG TPA: hypothetical protein VMS56_12050 [Thermoanaerobaculia bacterium]|nr:hypothetical protein [Thermoanaerobaculia bacterium]
MILDGFAADCAARLRHALLYVHDVTVVGMNAGKDVYTLMQEIELADDLRLPENYGTVRWPGFTEYRPRLRHRAPYLRHRAP